MNVVAMLDDIFCHLTPRQAFLLGRVDAAFSNFKFQESKIKPAQKELDETERGPGLASVADFYDGMRRDREIELREAVSRKVEAERFFRKCRHECIEAGAPEDIVTGYIDLLKKGVV